MKDSTQPVDTGLAGEVLFFRTSLAKTQEPPNCAEQHCARELAADLTIAKQIEFLAFVAHELRNPLAPSRTAAALLTRARPDELERAQHVIERQVAHMSRMVDDLLDVARGKTGNFDWRSPRSS